MKGNSMANSAKAKGSQAERDAAALLRAGGFPNADREFGAGRADDVGDVRNVPRTVIEVKAEKAFNPAGWLAEAEAERINAGAEYGIVFAKRPGKAMKDGYFIMRIEDGIALLREAIYSDNTLRKRLENLLQEI
jgi:hypothetical protein